MYEMRESYHLYERKRAWLLVLLCLWARDERGGGIMPKCGVCGWSFSDRTLMKHAETPCGEESEKAGRMPYAPEIDDLIKQEEEGNA